MFGIRAVRHETKVNGTIGWNENGILRTVAEHVMDAAGNAVDAGDTSAAAHGEGGLEVVLGRRWCLWLIWETVDFVNEP